jgi:cation transport ATPase
MGRWLESFAVAKTSGAIQRLLNLQVRAFVCMSGSRVFNIFFVRQPTIATLLCAGESSETRDIPLALLQVSCWSVFEAVDTHIVCSCAQHDDVVLVRPGARVPADGVVVWGCAFVDESLVTGTRARLLTAMAGLTP